MSPLIVEESPDETDASEASAFTSSVLHKMKYIRHRKLGFILFEGSVRHDEVARRLGTAEDVVSAGFVFTTAADFRCCGHSESLNVGVGPSDAVDLRDRITGF